MYDVLIIGAGAAGLTAAIYTARKKLKTAVLSMEVGGQTMLSSKMENYPGFNGPGFELMQKFKEQAESFGVELLSGKVVDVQKKDDKFTVFLSNGEQIIGKSVILAFGKMPKGLGIPGEAEYMGKGVHVCATCDAPLYGGKNVVVIGGGNSALESAILLSRIADKVYLMHRRDEFRGDEMLVEQVRRKENVEILLSYLPIEVKGEKFVSALVVKNLKDQVKKELNIDGVFLEVGYEVKAKIVQNLVKINEKNEIVVDSIAKTSCEGVFAAGDVTNIPYKQTVIAAGDGAKAGLSAYAYLREKEYVDTDISRK